MNARMRGVTDAVRAARAGSSKHQRCFSRAVRGLRGAAGGGWGPGRLPGPWPGRPGLFPHPDRPQAAVEHLIHIPTVHVCCAFLCVLVMASLVAHRPGQMHNARCSRSGAAQELSPRSRWRAQASGASFPRGWLLWGSKLPAGSVCTSPPATIHHVGSVCFSRFPRAVRSHTAAL